MRQKFLIERTPIRANAHGFVVLDRHFNNGRKLPILFVFETDIAGIDAIFIERFSTSGMVCQKLVTDIMKITDEGAVTPRFKSCSLI